METHGFLEGLGLECSLRCALRTPPFSTLILNGFAALRYGESPFSPTPFTVRTSPTSNCVCCGTWIRTKIACSRGTSPTIRRSRNIRAIPAIRREYVKNRSYSTVNFGLERGCGSGRMLTSGFHLCARALLPTENGYSDFRSRRWYILQNSRSA